MQKKDSEDGQIKVLPINDDPFIRPYAEYMFYDSIMNNSFRTGKLLAGVAVSDMSQFEWYYCSEPSFSRTDENSVEVFRNENADAYTCMYRELAETDSFEYRIDYQQYSNRWDDIHFFICEKDGNNIFDDNLISFGRYSGGPLLIKHGDTDLYLPYNQYSGSPYQRFKITVNRDCVVCMASVDGNEWFVIHECVVPIQKEKKYICGLDFNFSDSHYYKWIYNNFIQLRFNATDAAKLLYTDLLRRDFRIYTVNPIVKCATVKRKMLDDLHIDLSDYICSLIDNERYIEIWLNEKYIPGLRAYNKWDFDHESMIYGYNKNAGTFNVVSIKEGRPYLQNIDFSVIEAGYRNCSNSLDYMYTFEYSPTDGPYEYDFPHIFHRLEDYLLGNNPTDEYCYLLPKEIGEFGMDLYDAIMNDSENANVFLDDKRLPYVFFEHKKCMLRRIEFLNKEGFFEPNDALEILKMAENIFKNGEHVLIFAIKNLVFPSEETRNKVWKYMQKTREEEIRCYQKIINNAYVQ